MAKTQHEDFGHKSTVAEIRARFDVDVDRFSNLDTGQAATVDAPLALDLITEAASVTTPAARHVLDVGCGAGNFTLKLLQRLPGLEVSLLDLSAPMLERARSRVVQAGADPVHTVQGDVRDAPLAEGSVDIILAAAVLHHLRGEAEWRAVFARLHSALRPGGSLWVFDMVAGGSDALHAMMRRRYGEYLTRVRDAAYRDTVFTYIEREDTPRSLTFQLELMRHSGFADLEVLHKSACFAAYGGRRP